MTSPTTSPSEAKQRRVLNFDAIVVETIDVTKHGKTYSLRDDVPMTVMVRAFALQEQQLALREIEAPTVEQVEEWMAETAAQTLELCGAIFRHSLPEITDDEIVARFTLEEQTQLVMLFFSIRSAQLSRLANAPSGSSPSQPQSETEATTAGLTQASSVTGNRQSRRSGQHGKAGATTPQRRSSTTR